jgi:hypothetical protein
MSLGMNNEMWHCAVRFGGLSLGSICGDPRIPMSFSSPLMDSYTLYSMCSLVFIWVHWCSLVLSCLHTRAPMAALIVSVLLFPSCWREQGFPLCWCCHLEGALPISSQFIIITHPIHTSSLLCFLLFRCLTDHHTFLVCQLMMRPHFLVLASLLLLHIWIPYGASKGPKCPKKGKNQNTTQTRMAMGIQELCKVLLGPAMPNLSTP